MNKQDRKVLACVDQSHFADAVADYAAWAARRMDAPLELLHVIDRHLERGSGEDHSGAINKQLFSQRGSERTVGEGGGYATLRLGNQDYDATAFSPELDSNLATLTAGADFRYDFD